MSYASVCVCVSGIEALVRSLKEALRLTNLEVQTHGLLLLTKILDRLGPHNTLPATFVPVKKHRECVRESSLSCIVQRRDIRKCLSFSIKNLHMTLVLEMLSW